MTPQAKEERRRQILGSSYALGREDLAAHLADATELSALQATSILMHSAQRRLSLAELAKAKFQSLRGKT